MIYFFLYIGLLWNFSLAISFNVTVNVDSPIGNVSDKFISFTLDAYQVGQKDWAGMNFTELEPLAKALGPSYYRFGGTSADLLTFVENGTTYREKLAYSLMNITISGAQFDQLYTFTKNVGWRLIFDFDLLRRNSDDKWDPTNAINLLNYTTSKGYEYDFELGNVIISMAELLE
uniref:Uncharacterized protein n=1 Tax=Acrobeloides nanus TaxID=290746 RepID=A0A914DWT8_9BILA